ncbi:MAG: hypothetical protein C4523_18085, partial [Myxococcales bacterium]
MKQAIFPALRWTLLGLLVMAVFSSCSDSGDSEPGPDEEGETVDGDPEGDGDGETADEAEDDSIEAEEESPIEDGDEEVEPEMEFDPSEIDYEPEWPEFEIPEAGACDIPIGTDRCRYCGLPCEEAIDCPNGYVCQDNICTRECWPDLEDVGLDDCGPGWSCHLINYQYLFGVPSSYYCMPGSGGLCESNGDCLEGEVCGRFWPNWNWSALEPFCTVIEPCGAPEGTACDAAEDCDNQVCLVAPETGEAACSAFCDDDADCAPGRKCRERFEGSFLPPEYEQPRLYQKECQDPNQGLNCPAGEICKLKDCSSDRDCTTEGEICGGKRLNDTFENYALSCHRPVGGGLGFGETCSYALADGLECANTFCVPDDGGNWFCSEPCDIAAIDRYAAAHKDCPADFACYPAEMGRNPYDSLLRLTLDACLPQRGSFAECERDQDCPENEACAGLTEAPIDSGAKARADGDADDEEDAETADAVEDAETDTAEETDAEESGESVEDGDGE